MRWLAGLVPAVALLAAPPAFGAHAEVSIFNGKITAVYDAGSGEINDVTASGDSDGITFSDPGIAITAGANCSAPSTGTATCRYTSAIQEVRIDVEDGADAATNSTPLPSTLFGGEVLDSNPDVLTGGPAADYIAGGNGNDTIFGKAGNDELHGEGNSDTIYAGDGNDDVTGDDQGDPPGSNTLYGSTGNDSLITTQPLTGFNQSAYGGDGNDLLTSGVGSDTLSGGVGNDRMAPHPDVNKDVVNGGLGTDTADYLTNNSSTAVKVSLDDVANDGPKLSATDNVHSDIEKVWGGPANDELTGTIGAQTLTGFGGDDTLDGRQGPDLLFGGGGGDTVSYASKVNPVTATLDGQPNDGTAGENDTIEPDVEDLIGGQHDDVLIGSSGKNTLSGGDGADVLNGLGGDDALEGGGSNDTFLANPGADDMFGDVGIDTANYSTRVVPQSVTLDNQANDGSAGEGDNVRATEQVFGGTAGDVIAGDGDGNFFEGRGGPDTLIGAGNVDFLNGGNGADAIQAGDGDDVITNGSSADGADVVNGGPGSDLSNYGSRSNALTVSLDGVANDGETGENDNVKPSVERVFGGSGPDALAGSADDNVLAGGAGGDLVGGAAGNDTIMGDAGGDALFGGDDDDVIAGGLGADSMAGGPGSDTADYSGAGTGIDVTIDDVANDGVPAEGDNVKSTTEDVIGGRFDDKIDGDADPNTLFGGLGSDTLRGFGGPDVITGGKGGDDLRGGFGNDKLHAIDSTQDTLFCGPDTDGYAADNIDIVNADCENKLP